MLFNIRRRSEGAGVRICFAMKPFAFALLGSLLAARSLAREILVVPPEAFALIRAAACNQVADFFNNRPVAETPPYALVAEDNGSLQIAVWCTRDLVRSESQRTYTLLLRIDDPKSPLASCPREIGGIKHIGGLKFVNITEDATGYFFVGTKKRIATSGTLQTTGVESSYDGVGANYICVKGRWAFRSFD